MSLFTPGRLAEYRKLLVTLVTGVGAIVSAGVLHGRALEAVVVGLAVLTSLGVHTATNETPAPSVALDQPGSMP